MKVGDSLRRARGWRVAASLAVLASLTLAQSASAQMTGSGSGGGGGGGGRKHQQEPKTTDTTKPKADDKAYNAALKSLPDKPYDPWSGAR
jgi:hypothetical protein